MRIWEVDPQSHYAVLNYYLGLAQQRGETGAVEFLASELQKYVESQE